MDSRILLITANVGTIFENLNELVDPWLDEFTKKINETKPEFIALHMQEVGGKNYKQSMQLITPFFKKFLSNKTIRLYNRYLICVDSDFTDEINFTSLCNIYFIHENVNPNDVELFNFNEKSFVNYTTRQFFSGNLKNIDLLYKERFKKDLFKEFQWSRKGFLQTKWRIKKQIYDFVNIHLFHDPSNLIALNSTPSIYSENRKRALQYSLKRIQQNKTDDSSHISIFGDFNFRLDLNKLIGDLSNRSDSIEIKDNNNKLSRLVCKSNNKDVFTIEEKKFKWHSESSIQSSKNELLKYDMELSFCNEPLFELPKNFPPSYPFMEELDHPSKYMESRCPAWCDRIILNESFKSAIDNHSEVCSYGMIGENTCMGDHKPIYLFFVVKNTDRNPVKNSNQSGNLNLNNNNSNNLKMNKPSTIATSSASSIINNNSDFAYINNNLLNLNKQTTDIHDFAFFYNINSLKHMLKFSTYVSYYINNISPTKTLSPTSSLPEFFINKSSSSLDSDENNYVILNKWFESIVDFIILIPPSYEQTPSLTIPSPSSPLSSASDSCLNSQIYAPSSLTAISTSSNSSSSSTSNHATNNECTCILKRIDQTVLLKSYLIKFFLDSLNGNFYKLKHLYSYLNDVILHLNNDLLKLDPASISNNNNANMNQIDFSIMKKPLDHSFKSLVVLKEVYKFLTMPCTFNIFKLALNLNNNEKKFLFIHEPLFYLNKDDFTLNESAKKANNENEDNNLKQTVNINKANNNNDDSCNDMNGLQANLQSKAVFILNTGLNSNDKVCFNETIVSIAE